MCVLLLVSDGVVPYLRFKPNVLKILGVLVLVPKCSDVNSHLLCPLLSAHHHLAHCCSPRPAARNMLHSFLFWNVRQDMCWFYQMCWLMTDARKLNVTARTVHNWVLIYITNNKEPLFRDRCAVVFRKKYLINPEVLKFIVSIFH